MSKEEIRNRLNDSVGIQASSEWLDSCISFLQREQPQQSITADRCMLQVLHSDIRDIVDQRSPSMAFTSLHNLLQASQGAGSQETPSNFQLLVQLEECYDVSLSQEHRFNPQHSNKAQRCLKLCLATGYSSILVAQEVLRIPHLQTTSLAGLKLLIKGKVIIRRGILQLHGGNATVLGGSVAELVRLQQLAIEKAKKQAGVGVDPTLRALVNIQENADDDEQPEDEAHEESRDAPVMPQPSTAPRAPIPPPRDLPPPQSNSYARVNDRTPPPIDLAMPSATARVRNIAINASSTIRSSPAVARPRQAPPLQQQLQTTGPNPYARSSLSTAAPVPSRNEHSRSPPPVNRRPTNPYANPGPTIAVASTQAVTTVTGTATNAPLSTIVNRNPYQSGLASNNSNELPRGEPLREAPRATTNFTPLQAPLNTTITATTTPNTAVSSLMAPSPVPPPQTMAFGNLYSLIGQLVQNRQLFETYSQVVFQVAMRQLTDNIHFNIDKNQDYKKNKKLPKYVFVTNATFGTNNDSRLLACKVPPTTIERHFAKSATELRAMTKSNRVECDRLVKEGGDRVKAELFQSDIKLWKVTLCPTAEEVFEQATNPFELNNTIMPILVLQDDDN